MRVTAVIAASTAADAESKFEQIKQGHANARVIFRSFDRLQIIPLTGSGVSSKADIVADGRHLMLITFDE